MAPISARTTVSVESHSSSTWSRRGVRAVRPAELEKVPLAGAAGSDLSADVAERLFGYPHIGPMTSSSARSGSPRAVELDKRQQESFLPELDGVRCLGCGRLATDIHVMGVGGRETHEPVLEVHRRGDDDVVGVGGSVVRMVGDEEVTGVDPLWRELAQQMTHHRAHDAKLGRQVLGLADQFPARPEDGARVVEHVVDDSRVGAAPQGATHLLGCRDEAVGHDLAGDRVGTGRTTETGPQLARAGRGRPTHNATSTTIVPCSLTLATSSGGTQTVVSNCSTIKGPW